MTTQNKSTDSPAATSRGRLRKWLVVVGNILVITAGIYCAYSLAANRHEPTTGSPAVEVIYSQTHDGAVTRLARASGGMKPLLVRSHGS